MRIMRSMYIAGLAVVTLASCRSVKNVVVPTMDTAISITAKKGALTLEQENNWAHADLATDTIPGMSLQKAYDFLKGKNGVTVVVGVIDSGIDIEHEDLKDVLWTNPNEIADNGIDDDKNGYVDDIYGWNFLGGNGVDTPEQLEITRMYKKGAKRFTGVSVYNVSNADKTDYEKYLKLKESFEKRASKGINMMTRLDQILSEFKSIKAYLKKDSFELEDLKGIQTEDNDLMAQIGDITWILNQGATEKDVIKEQERLLKDKSYDLNHNGRMVKDDPEDIHDAIYGNQNVIGSKEDESHGTHVSGIILGTRNNNIGLDGVAHNAKLMTVRAVPNGDEYDKDVALAIRYCVDNGAKVVNMSFGKSYSPHSDWVFDAIKYAAKHDVLLVHASGNDGKNIDIKDNFPNDSKDKLVEISDNVITIGAISFNYNEKLPASFSNYGKKNVDVFAPGVKVYSTVPKNKYAKYNGTSMASPEVAGVATLVRSYYPQLSASTVKHIIMNSGTKIDMDVELPGKKEGKKVPFSDLSVSGRIVNAYNALVLADKIVNRI